VEWDEIIVLGLVTEFILKPLVRIQPLLNGSQAVDVTIRVDQLIILMAFERIPTSILTVFTVGIMHRMGSRSLSSSESPLLLKFPTGRSATRAKSQYGRRHWLHFSTGHSNQVDFW